LARRVLGAKLPYLILPTALSWWERWEAGVGCRIQPAARSRLIAHGMPDHPTGQGMWDKCGRDRCGMGSANSTRHANRG